MSHAAVFIRVVDASADDKEKLLRQAIAESRSAGHSLRVVRPLLESFESIPTSPFAYWAPQGVLDAFALFRRYESEERTALQGASTCDDFRYVRAWFEPTVLSAKDGPEEISWVGFARGGRFSRFYADVPGVVCWNRSRLSFHGFIGRAGRWNPKPVSADHYLLPALTWPLRGSAFSCSMLPSGCAFSVGGKVALAPREELPILAAILNSRAFGAVISLFAGKIGGFQFETGIINAAPVPDPDAVQRASLASCSLRAWSLERTLDSCIETSRAFVLPVLLTVEGTGLDSRAEAFGQRRRDSAAEVKTIVGEVDDLCLRLYGLNDEDQCAVVNGASVNVGDSADESEDHGDSEVEEEGNEQNSVAVLSLAAGLVSWGIGVVFGRFDVRLATGEQPMPREPDPFDPFPSCSPGMLTGGDGLPLSSEPGGYPVSFSKSGVLVEDPGASDDLGMAVRAVFDVVMGERADAWWNEVAEHLDPTGSEIRNWLRTGFFDYHLTAYSKSRRKAPIYWQLGTRSARYSVWLYAHRLTRDSFFQIQNDVVAPKLAHEERKLDRIVQNTGGSAKERKDVATQESLVEELRAMLEEAKRVAPLWNPNLDDGVVLTMALLWRLVPQHKAWQEELRARWDELCAGKYDWAHVAMHLWPERVVPKCAKDRSVAIAHGLEAVFWVVGDHGKWTARSKPTRPVDELVKERTSSAVKAALASLLNAPAPGANMRSRRKRGSAASAKGNR